MTADAIKRFLDQSDLLYATLTCTVIDRRDDAIKIGLGAEAHWIPNADMSLVSWYNAIICDRYTPIILKIRYRALRRKP